MLDDGTIRAVVEVAAGAVASAFGWSVKREVARHDNDMTSLKTQVATLQETTVNHEELEHLADDIKTMIRDHADTAAKSAAASAQTLGRIEARVDQLFTQRGGR